MLIRRVLSRKYTYLLLPLYKRSLQTVRSVFLHATWLVQALAHWPIFLTAASRRSPVRISVPVWGGQPLSPPIHHWLGRPLPYQLSNGPHAHPLSINLYCKVHANFAMHNVLVRLSSGYPLIKGRLHTCYAPVRRSSSKRASSSHVTPRLACVKPIASVHPEPGSNSPLLFQFVKFFLRLTLECPNLLL